MPSVASVNEGVVDGERPRPPREQQKKEGERPEGQLPARKRAESTKRHAVAIPKAVWENVVDRLPQLAGLVSIAAAFVAAGHAMLFKRDVRAAAGWVGFIFFVPAVGTLLYLLFGINRIRRRALVDRTWISRSEPILRLEPPRLSAILDASAQHLQSLAALVDQVNSRPLLRGNDIELLQDGDRAYPAMLEAIDAAQKSVALLTYIFDDDAWGRRFVDALARARERGVEVRVLLDDAGARYSRPPIDARLRRRGVPVARFMRALAPRFTVYLNLRNHRKILVVDGKLGFTGGMNIRAGSVLADEPREPIRDLHFRLEGPVVAQLQQVFAEDWRFCTKEVLRGEVWFPELEVCGEVAARGLADGPDSDFGVLRWTLLGAIACARRSVRIMTPYFLPDQAMMTALNVAALRGVRVDILLPLRSNLPLVQWAMQAQIEQVLGHGCKVWLDQGPFAHGKLMVVDERWVLLGSANWDARSLRLNFEFCVEAYHEGFGEEMAHFFEGRRHGARLLERGSLRSRPLPLRLRDALARLMTPYL